MMQMWQPPRRQSPEAMAYAGQKCTATSRVIVSRKLAPALVAALSDAVAGLAVGDPMDESTTVGLI